MEKSETSSFSSMDESLLNEIINFVHPNDRYLFKYEEFGCKNDLSKEEFKIHLINNEFGLINEDIQLFYKRIERLTNLNSHLDKFLTESNDQRYNQFIDTSFYQDFSEKFSETTNKILKTMRKNFDDYKISTLYDFNKILNGYNRLNRLKNSLPFLYIYKEMNKIVEYSKKLEIPVVYRILACALGIKYCLNVSRNDPRVMNTIFFNSVKDNFSRNIDKLMVNIFVKNQYRYDPCDKLLILLMFGQTSEQSCECVISFLKDELVSIASLNIQRYLNLDREFVGYKLNGLSSKDVSDQAALLPPNLSILVVCKILSEFVSFFQTLTSRLKYESKIMQSNHVRSNDTGSSRLNALLNSLNKTDYYLYYRNTLDLFIDKFSELADASFDILYKVLSSVNLNGLKDQNDVLKIALLILYYTKLLEEVKKHEKEGNLTLEGSTKEPKYKHVGLDNEIAEILNDFCDKNLKVFKNENQLSDSNTGYDRLQGVLSRVLNDYSRRFTSEAMGNVSISLTSDTFQRLAVHPVSFDNMKIDGYCKIFNDFVSNGHFMYFGDFKFTTLNPFLGWTPNSNFVKINISSPLLVNYNAFTIKSDSDKFKNQEENKYTQGKEKEHNNKEYREYRTERDDNNNKEQEQEKEKEAKENSRSIDLKNSRLVRDYGGVYTVTSRQVLRSFETYFKVIMVLDSNCVEVIKCYTKLVDEFIYKNVKGCKMEECVIENLKKFNAVFNSEERNSEMSTGSTTCDTYRQEYVEDRVSDITKLAYAVNTVESCYTILESLLKVIKNNEGKNNKFCKYLTKYYNERTEVIVELRLMLYHIAIYNILRPKLPSMKLLTAIRSTKPLHIDTDVDKTFRDFQSHLRSVREFVESADSGSFPIMVKVFIWDSIINVIKDSFKPVLNLINNNLNSELEKTISKNYSETLKLSSEIRAQYVDQVKVDYKRHKVEIANVSTYYNLVEGMLNSLKG